MVDGLRERDKLRSAFGKYMTETVMEHLLKGKVELGGEQLSVTILFTDIRGFTTLSESMPAQELVQPLNEYFTEMVTIVIQEGGVVDKYGAPPKNSIATSSSAKTPSAPPATPSRREPSVKSP